MRIMKKEREWRKRNIIQKEGKEMRNSGIPQSSITLMGAGIVLSVSWLWYRMDDPGFKSWQGQEGFLFSKMTRPLLEPIQSPVQQVPEFFPGVQQMGHQVDHSPSASTDIKNECSYTSAPHARLHSVDRDNFTSPPFPITLIFAIFRQSSSKRTNFLPMQLV